MWNTKLFQNIQNIGIKHNKRTQNIKNDSRNTFKSPYMIPPEIVREYLKCIIYLCILPNNQFA